MNFKVNVSASAILKNRGLGDSTKARKYLASTVKRLCDPYVPMSSGSAAHMKSSAQVAEDGSQLIYPGPYAHYQHKGEAMAGRAPKHYTGRELEYHGGPMRGEEWDKRMMADRGNEVIDDLAKFVGGKRK